MSILSRFDFFRFILTVQALFVGFVVYRAFLHPLRKIPGPFIAKLTSLWLWYHAYYGTESTAIQEAHEKYGPIIRIGPNEVNIDDGAAIQPIYVKNGGLPKNPCYSNFDIDGYSTIFSALDHAHRTTRAKTVVNLFSQQSIREGKDVICACVDKMVDRLQRAIKESEGNPVDVLMIFRSLATDVVTSYLFGKSMNGLDEEKLSARFFVDSFVSVGRWFYVPPLLSWFIDLWDANYNQQDEDLGMTKMDLWKSNVAVDKYTVGITEVALKAVKAGDDEELAKTYQGRMLQAGIVRDEVIGQCKDLIFAGTDSTGTNLSTAIFQLAQNPKIYERLREELLASPEADPQTLPYCSAVIKETLRVAMANPTRIPRIVGKGGLHIDGYPSIAEGTSVSVCIWSLHFNNKVYPDAHVFRPERWLDATPEMSRDNIAFGAGTRQCIARNLATAELFWGVEAIVRKDLLKGAKPVESGIAVVQWFNSRIVGGKVELKFPVMAAMPNTGSVEGALTIEDGQS